MGEWIVWFTSDEEAMEWEDRLRDEVVRCSDCANYDADSALPGCTLFDFSVLEDMSEGFCAWATRRWE